MFASPGEYVKLNIYGKVVSYSADEKSDCLTLVFKYNDKTRIYLSSKDLEMMGAKRVKPVSTFTNGIFSTSWIDISEEDK